MEIYMEKRHKKREDIYRVKIYMEKRYRTYMEKRHIRSGDTYRVGTHIERIYKQKKNIDGEAINIKWRQIQKGDKQSGDIYRKQKYLQKKYIVFTQKSVIYKKEIQDLYKEKTHIEWRYIWKRHT